MITVFVPLRVYLAYIAHWWSQHHSIEQHSHVLTWFVTASLSEYCWSHTQQRDASLTRSKVGQDTVTHDKNSSTWSIQPFLYQQLEALTSIHRHGNVFMGLKLRASRTGCRFREPCFPLRKSPILLNLAMKVNPKPQAKDNIARQDMGKCNGCWANFLRPKRVHERLVMDAVLTPATFATSLTIGSPSKFGTITQLSGSINGMSKILHLDIPCASSSHHVQLSRQWMSSSRHASFTAAGGAQVPEVFLNIFWTVYQCAYTDKKTKSFWKASLKKWRSLENWSLEQGTQATKDIGESQPPRLEVELCLRVLFPIQDIEDKYGPKHNHPAT